MCDTSDFGGFVANEKSAELNSLTGALTPPSKEILLILILKLMMDYSLLMLLITKHSHELAKKRSQIMLTL